MDEQQQEIELRIRRLAEEVAAQAPDAIACTIRGVLLGRAGVPAADSPDYIHHLHACLHARERARRTHALTHFAEDLRHGRLGDAVRCQSEGWWDLAEAIGSDRAANRRAYREFCAGNRAAAAQMTPRLLRSLRALEGATGPDLRVAQEVGTLHLAVELALLQGHAEMAARAYRLLAEQDFVVMDAEKLQRLAGLALQYASAQAEGPAADAEAGAVRVIQSFVHDEREKNTLRRLLPLTLPIPKAAWPSDDRWAARLLAMYPWNEALIHELLRHATWQRNMGQPFIQFPPMLLVGDRGTSKTSFARSLGKELGLATVFLNFAGAADNMALKGAARGWGTSRPSYLLEAIARHRTPNLLVQADEVDKIARDTRNGNAAHTLLSLLEKQSARSMLDEYLLGDADLSHLNWIATANDLRALSSPLRSRFHVVHVDGPGPEHFDTILRNIRRSTAEELALREEFLPDLPVEIVEELRQGFRQCRDMRRLRRAVEVALAGAAVKRPALLN